MKAAVRNLEAVFALIARTRMADVPILNPLLQVEAVGFRGWQGRWVGVLVTPWMINLVMLPGPEAALAPLAPDETKVWDFPSGGYAFMGLNEPAIGPCHICPLISPVTEFSSHEEARAVAHDISAGLFSENPGEDKLAARMDEARLKGEAVSRQPMSRRDFLRMPFMGG